MKKGTIVELYATVLEGERDSFIDVFNNEDEAKSQIGSCVDGKKIIAVKKGYSFAPVGSDILYNEAPDFCESKIEAILIAKNLGIAIQ